MLRDAAASPPARGSAMRFAIVTWAGDDARPESIFGVIDEKGSGKLPGISPHGYWADFRIIDEAQFKFADEAKKSIGKDGYYLMGAGVTATEAFRATSSSEGDGDGRG
jgi:hypothetical protein